MSVLINRARIGSAIRKYICVINNTKYALENYIFMQLFKYLRKTLVKLLMSIAL